MSMTVTDSPSHLVARAVKVRYMLVLLTVTVKNRSIDSIKGSGLGRNRLDLMLD